MQRHLFVLFLLALTQITGRGTVSVLPVIATTVATEFRTSLPTVFVGTSEELDPNARLEKRPLQNCSEHALLQFQNRHAKKYLFVHSDRFRLLFAKAFL
ncbi:hypothetical protein LJR221_004115 [Agrobacterium tumefaciens]